MKDMRTDAISKLPRKASLLPICKPVRVYADMVADLFHAGHVNFLRQCRELGDPGLVTLVVGVHDDATVASYKRSPVCTMEERAACVQSCKYVDEVITSAPLEVEADYIAKHRIDIVVAGSGSSSRESMYGAAIRMGVYTEVYRTPDISSSDIIQRILSRGGDQNLQDVATA